MASITKDKTTTKSKKPKVSRVKSTPDDTAPKTKNTRRKAKSVGSRPEPTKTIEAVVGEMMDARGTVYEKFAGENRRGQRCLAITMTPERMEKLQGLFAAGKDFEMPRANKFDMILRVLDDKKSLPLVTCKRADFFKEFAEPKDWSQGELLDLEWLQTDLENADRYKKTKRIWARQVRKGTEIVTICHDGKAETTNKAKEDGDYCVMNPIGANEQWIIEREKFEDRYEVAEHPEFGLPPSQDWDEFKAKPGVEIMAIEMTASLMEKMGWHGEGYFVANWGEAMLCMENDFLVMPSAGDPEIYRIGRKEFFDTYSKVEETKGKKKKKSKGKK